MAGAESSLGVPVCEAKNVGRENIFWPFLTEDVRNLANNDHSLAIYSYTMGR